jgi:hypothetical protein
MHAVPNSTTRCADLLRGLGPVFALAVCSVFVAASVVCAQAPQAPPQSTEQSAPAPEAVPAAEAQPAPQPPEAAQAPALSSPPVAIVPLDKSIPGAALSVAGPLQAWNGRAFITGSGTITAGSGTAQVTLPYRGTLHVCASSTVKLAADSSTPAGEVPGLLIALDHGAVEMSLAASTARERNADSLLTPYFRILIGGPSAADVKVRLGEHGDTCVDNAGVPSDRFSSLGRNAGVGAPYVVVTSVFDGGIYRVQAGQRVMFEHGSLHEVVDQEKEPCGCPPPAKTESNEFPLAQSEGLAPSSASAPVASPLSGHAPNTTDTFVYNGADRAAQTATGPQAAATPAQAQNANPAPKPAAAKKKGFFRKIGGFFRRVFGAG